MCGKKESRGYLKMESFRDNLILGLMDIKYWKKQYITKQLKKYPNISRERLSMKIKNAKRSYFGRHHKEFDEIVVKDIQGLHKEVK